MATFHCHCIKAHGGNPLRLSLIQPHKPAHFVGYWFPPWASQFPHRLIWGPPWGQSPPSFRYWGLHGGPHGGPNGGQFPPWGTTFFLTLFCRVNTPSRGSPIFVRVRMYPYFVHTKFEVNWCKGYRVIRVGRIAGPHGQLGHFTQSQFSGDLVIFKHFEKYLFRKMHSYS